MTKPTLLLAMERIAAVYAFSRGDLLTMSIRELRWWARSAAGRESDRLSLLTALFKSR